MSNEEYICLVNKERQYSIWIASKEIPFDWEQERPKGSKGICLEYIKDTWTDMLPISLRKQMEEQKNNAA